MGTQADSKASCLYCFINVLALIRVLLEHDFGLLQCLQGLLGLLCLEVVDALLVQFDQLVLEFVDGVARLVARS